MILDFYRKNEKEEIPLLTFEGQPEVDAVAAAALIASEECRPRYIGQKAMASILPGPILDQVVRVEEAIGSRRGADDFDLLARVAMMEATGDRDTDPDSHRLLLIGSYATVAISALEKLSKTRSVLPVNQDIAARSEARSLYAEILLATEAKKAFSYE
ncbi:hypothetical protein H7X68_02640 [Candidatus Saccharibacteria bacterium]|nr:hypothetical protein [Candidatus Saccharibacteria bacterium]